MAGCLELDMLASKRFGVVAARLTSPTAPMDHVDLAAAEAGVDLLTVRVEAGDLERVHLLEAAGFRLMDTLVYFQRATHPRRGHASGLEKDPGRVADTIVAQGSELKSGARLAVEARAVAGGGELQNAGSVAGAAEGEGAGAAKGSGSVEKVKTIKGGGVLEGAGESERSQTRQPRVRLAVAADLGPVSRIAEAAFRDYIGHFHADPKLDNRSADAAYVEWAENNVRSCSASAPVLVACCGPRSDTHPNVNNEEPDQQTEPVGFLCLERNGSEMLEITLNAVHPHMQKRGVYTALVGAAIEQARRLGARRLVTSTQINNYGVQRIWCRLGFAHFKSVYTFHKWYL